MTKSGAQQLDFIISARAYFTVVSSSAAVRLNLSYAGGWPVGMGVAPAAYLPESSHMDAPR